MVLIDILLYKEEKKEWGIHQKAQRAAAAAAVVVVVGEGVVRRR